MTTASEHAAPDRERAETYLRLLAETELRRALAMPEYKPRREPMPVRVVALLVSRRLMRRRRAHVQRIMQRKGAGPGGANIQNSHASQPRAAQLTAALMLIRRAEDLAKAARAIAAPPTATMLKAGSRAGSQLGAAIRPLRWQFQRQFLRPRRRDYQPPPAEACLTRVETLASVFAAVGAITAETEENVVAGLRAALAARSRIEQNALLSYYSGSGIFGYHRGFRGQPMHRRATTHPAPAGPPRAHPVGISASGMIEGAPVRFYFGVLVLEHGSATLTVQARFPVELEEQDHGHMDPVYEALSQIGAVDDRGATYRADFNGGGGGGDWNGRFHLSPTPPPGARWLDMTMPGVAPVRVRLDGAPRDLQITTEPATTSTTDRFLDAQTIQLLCHDLTDLDWESGDGDPDGQSLFQIASHLVAAGVLTADSPSLRRLAAAAARLNTPLPDPLAAIEPADLPTDWLSLLSRADCTDGPTGAIPIAAVLPEVDGIRCIIEDLVSKPESATMQVHARGLPEPRQLGGARSEQIWWSARDDVGGRYVVGEGGWSSRNGEADLDLEFSPPINPRAQVLDIILAGPTKQVTVTLPLDWQEAL